MNLSEFLAPYALVATYANPINVLVASMSHPKLTMGYPAKKVAVEFPAMNHRMMLLPEL
jgi:hypothetical protein